jgi:hypothetical protein
MLALYEKLQGNLAELNRLPTSYIEPLDIKTALVAPSMSAASRPLDARIFAPGATSAESLSLGRVSSWVQPGGLIKLRLALLECEDDCVAAEVAAQSIMRLARVDASVRSAPEPPSSLTEQLLEPLFSTAASAGCVVVRLPVPATALAGSSITVHGITLAGMPVVSHPPFPIVVSVMRRRGLQRMGTYDISGSFDAGNHTPAVSDDGVLYIPRYDSPDVAIFTDDLVQQGTLMVSDLGLSFHTRVAAVDTESQTLLLSDFNKDKSIIAAVDLSTSIVKWRTTPGDFSTCGQLAVMKGRGVFVATSCDDFQIHVHRLVDGIRIASATATSRTSYVAYDAVSGLIFVSYGYSVWAYSWDGSALALLGKVKQVSTTRDARPMAVVPPSNAGSSHSHLVVGTYGRDRLHVMCLPASVHATALEEIAAVEEAVAPASGALAGMAADATGTSVVLCRLMHRPAQFHVVAWPLLGIPEHACY